MSVFRGITLQLLICLLGVLQAYGSLSDDVTVIFHFKEQIMDEKLLPSIIELIDPSVRIIVVPFYPLTYPENSFQELTSKFQNVEVIPKSPHHDDTYQTNFHVRKRLLTAQENQITTKFTLLCEFRTRFSSDFIPSIVQYAKAAQATELNEGSPLSRIFVPQLIEECPKKKKNKQRPHPTFPLVFLWKTARKDSYFLQPGGSRIEIDKFIATDTFDEQTREYIYYVEDHVILVDTEFYREHIDLLSLVDGSWNQDHIFLALMTHAKGGRVLLAPQVAYLEFYCDAVLETLHINAWRRSYHNMARMSDLFSEMFGIEMDVTWHWVLEEFDRLLPAVGKANVLSYSYFELSNPEANLRHANLIIGTLLLTSLENFTIYSGDEILHEDLDSSEVLREIYVLYNEQNSTNCLQTISLSAERTYKIQQYAESLPNLQQEVLQVYRVKDDVKEYNDCSRSLPGFCLYHTGLMKEQLAPSRMFFRLLVTDQLGNQYDHFLWHRYKQADYNCPLVTTHEGQSYHLVTRNSRIPLPSLHQQVAVESIKYNYFNKKPN